MAKIKLAAFSDEAADSISGQIEALKRNGLLLMELRSIDKKNVSNFSVAESKEYYKIMKDEGVAVWSIGSPLGKVDINVDFDSYLDTVKRVCESAVIFGTDKIRVFSFYNAFFEREKVFDYLSKMVETAESFGVKMYHENEKEIYGDRLSRVLDIMQNVKGLKYIYDPANYIQVGEKATETLEALHKTTDYFHIKDVVAETGELVPSGYGDGKIETLVKKIDRDITFTVEPHLALFDAYKSIDDSEMKLKFRFNNNGEAFDCAVSSIKRIIVDCGYKEIKGDFVL